MFIKILQKGWEGYTGHLGPTIFENGVSKNHMPRHEAMALGAQISIVEIDEDGNEGNPVSPAWDMVRSNQLRATVVPPSPRESDLLKEQAEKDAADAEVVDRVKTKGYTREELEEIASEKGIGGIREISNPLDIRGTAIRGLIEEILLRQPRD